MNRKLPLLALLLVAASAYAADSQVYKWTDAGGVVHYSDAPPPKDAQNVQTVRLGSGERPHALATDSADSEDKPAADTTAAKPPTPADTAMADNADNRVKACGQARSNLELLQSKFPVSVAGADGKTQPLDDKARQSQIADANAQVALYCR